MIKQALKKKTKLCQCYYPKFNYLIQAIIINQKIDQIMIVIQIKILKYNLVLAYNLNNIKLLKIKQMSICSTD